MSGRKRGEKDLTSFFTSGTSGGWRDALSPAEADLVVSTCVEFMDEAGYDI